MYLRSPAEFYIKALLVSPEKLSLDKLRKRLDRKGIDPISEDYLDGLKEELFTPKPFFPLDRRHSPSVDFLMREQLFRFFHPDPPMKVALQLLDRPRIREFVETLLLASAPTSSIAEYVTRQRRLPLTITAIDLYTHYFWNLELLDTTQTRLLLRLRFDRAEEYNQLVFSGKKKTLETAYHKDARKAAAEMPHSPAGALLALTRLGMQPTQKEISGSLAEMQRLATLRGMEALSLDGPYESQRFLNYAQGAKILAELAQIGNGPELKMQEELTKVILKTEEKRLPLLSELSGGNHTVDTSSVSHEPDSAPKERNPSDG